MSLFFFYLLSLIAICSANNNDKKTPNCFDDICIEAGYSPDVAPKLESNQPIVVNMVFKVDNVLSVDHDHNIIGLTVSLRQTWMDHRIHARNNSLLKSNRWLPVPTRMGRNPETGIPEHIWMPKLFIYWLKKMELKSNFQEQSLIWLFEKNNTRFLHYDTCFDIHIKCRMKYQRYPFDEHICPMKLASADLSADKLIFNMSSPVKWGRHENNLGYFDTQILPLNDKELYETWENEKWSIAGFKLRLRRRHWKYIFNYYLSSGLFVVISWVSFLVPSGDVNARMALLITALLILVTVYNSAIEMSPKASEGPTAIGFWMFSMLIFVLLAFICHCITMLQRKSKDSKRSALGKHPRKQLTQINNLGMIEPGNIKETAYSTTLQGESKKQKHQPNSNALDLIILLVLLILFLSYIVIYAVLYK